MKYLIYKKSGRLPIKIKIDKFVWSYAIQALGNYYTDEWEDAVGTLLNYLVPDMCLTYRREGMTYYAEG